MSSRAWTSSSGGKNASPEMRKSLRMAQDDALNALGLYRFRIIPDGNCLFRAVASQLGLKQSRYQNSLRRAAAEWCVQHEQELNNAGLLDPDEVKEMFRDGSWSGQAALVALANLLEVDIAVFHGGDRGEIDIQHVSPFASHSTDDVDSILLGYLYDGHYDGVVERRNMPNPDFDAWREGVERGEEASEKLAHRLLAENRPLSAALRVDNLPNPPSLQTILARAAASKRSPRVRVVPVELAAAQQRHSSSSSSSLSPRRPATGHSHLRRPSPHRHRHRQHPSHTHKAGDTTMRSASPSGNLSLQLHDSFGASGALPNSSSQRGYVGSTHNSSLQRGYAGNTHNSPSQRGYAGNTHNSSKHGQTGISFDSSSHGQTGISFDSSSHGQTGNSLNSSRHGQTGNSLNSSRHGQTGSSVGTSRHGYTGSSIGSPRHGYTGSSIGSSQHGHAGNSWQHFHQASGTAGRSLNATHDPIDSNSFPTADSSSFGSAYQSFSRDVPAFSHVAQHESFRNSSPLRTSSMRRPSAQNGISTANAAIDRGQFVQVIHLDGPRNRHYKSNDDEMDTNYSVRSFSVDARSAYGPSSSSSNQRTRSVSRGRDERDTSHGQIQRRERGRTRVRGGNDCKVFTSDNTPTMVMMKNDTVGIPFGLRVDPVARNANVAQTETRTSGERVTREVPVSMVEKQQKVETAPLPSLDVSRFSTTEINVQRGQPRTKQHVVDERITHEIPVVASEEPRHDRSLTNIDTLDSTEIRVHRGRSRSPKRTIVRRHSPYPWADYSYDDYAIRFEKPQWPIRDANDVAWRRIREIQDRPLTSTVPIIRAKEFYIERVPVMPMKSSLAVRSRSASRGREKTVSFGTPSSYAYQKSLRSGDFANPYSNHFEYEREVHGAGSGGGTGESTESAVRTEPQRVDSADHDERSSMTSAAPAYERDDGVKNASLGGDVFRLNDKLRSTTTKTNDNNNTTTTTTNNNSNNNNGRKASLAEDSDYRLRTSSGVLAGERGIGRRTSTLSDSSTSPRIFDVAVESAIAPDYTQNSIHRYSRQPLVPRENDRGAVFKETIRDIVTSPDNPPRTFISKKRNNGVRSPPPETAKR